MEDELKQEIDSPDEMIPMICKVHRLQFIRLINHEFPPDHQIPLDAKVTIEIPAGGDFSGIDLPVEQIVVRWRGHPPGYFDPAGSP